MTVITHSRRKSRLAKMIDSAGGVAVGVALTRARENIGKLRGKALKEVTRHIGELAALQQPTTPDEKDESLRRIYHSANHVIDADQILVLKAGRIVERGGHHELVARQGGEYAALWRKQTRGARTGVQSA